MTTNNTACCGGAPKQSDGAGPATGETGRAAAASGIRPGLIDRKVTLMISAGAAMAGNCEPCLRTIVPKLRDAGASGDEIRSAILIGQTVKDRPASIMKQVADELAGTRLSEEPPPEGCPADAMKRDDKYRITMLISAGAAMAANCELCLSRIIPDLVEAGVSETDMRKAVEIGQFIKDKPAAVMKEAADMLTGSNLSAEPAGGECSPRDTQPSGGCCA